MAGTTTLLLGMNLCSSPVLAETVDSTDAGVDTSTPQTTGSMVPKVVLLVQKIMRQDLRIYLKKNKTVQKTKI